MYFGAIVLCGVFESHLIFNAVRACLQQVGEQIRAAHADGKEITISTVIVSALLSFFACRKLSRLDSNHIKKQLNEIIGYGQGRGSDLEGEQS